MGKFLKAITPILIMMLCITAYAEWSPYIYYDLDDDQTGFEWYSSGERYTRRRGNNVLHVEYGLDGYDWYRANDVRNVYLEDYGTSSYLIEPERPYPASNIFDDSHNYAWSEGVYGPGIGEEIHAEWYAYGKRKLYAAGIAIENGYQKTEKIYQRNNRIRDAEIEINGNNYRVRLFDYRDWQVICFPKPIRIDDSGINITLTICSVYPGNECDDTCVTRMDLMIMDEYGVDSMRGY